MGNSMGRAPLGRSDMEATTGWTEGKPWEIVWGELRCDGAIRKRRQGGWKTTVGNSLGRAPLGRSETEATIGWTEGKPREIAWGEFRGEGAIRKRRQEGRKGNHGNGMGRAPL